jgi:hypothetical protein
MRELIVTENITLDGVIEATESWFSPAGGEDAISDVETGVTDYLNDVSKYVVSGTLHEPEWERTAVPRSVDDIPALKSEMGVDIVTTRSIRLVRELIAAGLVDEYPLFIYPVVLGRAANGSSRTRARSHACVWWRASPSAPASCSCATGQPDGASTVPERRKFSTTPRQPRA